MMSLNGYRCTDDNASRIASWRGWHAIAVVCCLTLAGVGCSPKSPAQPASGPVMSNISDSKHELRQALDFLNRMEEFDSLQVHEKIRNHLRQWLKQKTADPNWQIDPLVSQAPAGFQALLDPRSLAALEWQTYDTYELQEASWMRQIATSVVSQNPLPTCLAREIERTLASLDPDQATMLTQATLLFDWTVRNLQLEPDLDGVPVRYESNLGLYSWETLLFGHGTTAEKARVFGLLARQLGLPVIALGLETSPGEVPRYWRSALLLGDELYLFDMRAGTPVPGREIGRIATLNEVGEKPLEPPQRPEAQTGDDQGAERGENGEGLAGEQLSSDDPASPPPVIALLDATPACVSQRMAILEAALLGDDKLVLSQPPSPLKEKLAALPAVAGVEIWSLPYEAFVARGQLDPNSRTSMFLASEHTLFNRRTPLQQGRLLQFKGWFENQDDRRGARAMLLDCRMSDAQIEAIGQTPFPETTRDGTPVQPSPEQRAAFQQQLRSVELLMVETKYRASYWLGAMAQDRGNAKVAVDFFDARVLKGFPYGIWTDGAQYNLGRAWEAIALDQDDANARRSALDAFRQVPDDSPWAEACRQRVERLETE